MSVPGRLAGLTTEYSKVVLVALLLTTAVIGSGVASLDDDSSLDQFESDSPELEASEYISDNFTVEERENTTTVQLIVRGDNVLTKESIVSSLEFQQTIRENESINATLHEEDAFIGVENILAISEIRGEEFEELENRADELEEDGEALNDSADELEAEFEELNESADELEAEFEELNESAEALNESADELEARGNALERSGERLERDAEELEEDAAELEADQAALETRMGYLEEGLNETAALQGEYEEAAFFGQPTDPIEEDIDDALSNATEDANLNGEQEDDFLHAASLLRENVSATAGLEIRIQAGPSTITGVDDPNDPDNQILQTALQETVALQTLVDEGERDEAEVDAEIEQLWEEAANNASLTSDQKDDFEDLGTDVRNLTTESNNAPPTEDAYQLGTMGVFEDELADLEERGQELEERGDELEERGDRIQDLSRDLERDADELEEEGDRLEEWGDDLEARADELEAWGDDLEERADELEAEGDRLEARGDALEADFEALEDADDPTLSEQIEHLEGMNETAFEDAIADTLSDDDDNSTGALEFMSTNYEPGSTQADARMTFITQVTDAEMDDMGGFEGDASEAQLDLRDLANGQDEDYVIFGFGVISDEIDRSMSDSLAIVGPLALLFVVLALFVAYRDPLDIALGVVGIITVLVWTLGFMGWAGIAFNQMFVAVPVLLIGLSIDYAIHVFMRHREQRERGGITDDVSGSMIIALAGVGVALVWVTATTMIGFLANLISPIEPIREFGVVSAFGILSALIVFGMLVPAAKVEIDSFLEGRGIDRRKRAFGTGSGRLGEVLGVGAVAARKAPLVVLVAVLLLTAGGVYGATQVDTSFDEEDFLAESPPEWTERLGPLAPGEYQAKADLEFVNENFQREDSQARILIQGNVTDPETLERIDAAESVAADSDVAYVLASGEADVRSPLSAMDDAASDNESFNESFTAADTTGDGIPDEDLEGLYDELLEVDDGVADVLYRTEDGDYEAVQVIVSIRGDAAFGDVTTEMREIAGTIDDDGTDPRWSAIATGDPIVNHVVEGDLLDTVLESLMITLVVVFAFLTLAYWLTGKGAALGTVTLLPVALAVSWILGTMYLIGMPFNVLTGMITSLTIGLGVAYSIHVSSRYTLELDRQGNVWDALETTVTGTGGALLGSAATTVGGFGTLALAILPVLRQFGIITGMTIIYAFLASVIVLPTLLVLWTRYLGPSDVSFDYPSSSTPRSGVAASDGGHDEHDQNASNAKPTTERELDPRGGSESNSTIDEIKRARTESKSMADDSGSDTEVDVTEPERDGENVERSGENQDGPGKRLDEGEAQ